MSRFLFRKIYRPFWFLLLIVALAAFSVPSAALADGPTVRPDTGNFVTTFCLFAGGFTPYENVALWVQHPDGRTEATIPSSSGQANRNGKLGPQESDLNAGYACFYAQRDWENGEYLIVAHGLKSGYEATAHFTYTGAFPTGSTAGLVVDDQSTSPSDTPWFTFTGYGFTPLHRVDFWLGAPDGRIIAIDNAGFSDETGKVLGTFQRGDLTLDGEYRLVASDGRNEYWTTFRFILNDVNTLQAPTGTGLVYTPDAGPYQTFFIGSASGFAPYEIIDEWTYVPNGGFFTDFVQADANGKARVYWQSYTGEPVGTYQDVLRGRTSKVQVSGKFTVIDTVPDP